MQKNPEMRKCENSEIRKRTNSHAVFTWNRSQPAWGPPPPSQRAAHRICALLTSAPSLWAPPPRQRWPGRGFVFSRGRLKPGFGSHPPVLTAGGKKESCEFLNVRCKFLFLVKWVIGDGILWGKLGGARWMTIFGHLLDHVKRQWSIIVVILYTHTQDMRGMVIFLILFLLFFSSLHTCFSLKRKKEQRNRKHIRRNKSPTPNFEQLSIVSIFLFIEFGV